MKTEQRWENHTWKATWSRGAADFFFAFKVAAILFCVPMFIIIAGIGFVIERIVNGS